MNNDYLDNRLSLSLFVCLCLYFCICMSHALLYSLYFNRICWSVELDWLDMNWKWIDISRSYILIDWSPQQQTNKVKTIWKKKQHVYRKLNIWQTRIPTYENWTTKPPSMKRRYANYKTTQPRDIQTSTIVYSFCFILILFDYFVEFFCNLVKPLLFYAAFGSFNES